MIRKGAQRSDWHYNNYEMDYAPSMCTLWHGLTDVGDGHESGQPIELHGSITRNLLLKMLTHRVAMFDPEEPREVSVTRSPFHTQIPNH